MTSDSFGYSSDWVSEAGLDLDPGYCITLVRGVDPRTALCRIGAGEATIRTAPWPELVAHVSALEPAHRHIPAAAFVLGEHTVLVEENGYRGHHAEWNLPLSRGAEVVSVYLSPTQGNQTLSIVRDGEQLAFIDGDAPEVIHADDEELADRLIQLSHDALKPWDRNGSAPEDFDDGWVDLLQVACGHLGLRPRVADFSGPVPGAPLKL